MSSWIGDWERNLIRKKGANAEANYRTQCKLGGELMRKDTPATWLTDPMGLSCDHHVQEAEAAKAALEGLAAGLVTA